MSKSDKEKNGKSFKEPKLKETPSLKEGPDADSVEARLAALTREVEESNNKAAAPKSPAVVPKPSVTSSPVVAKSQLQTADSDKTKTSFVDNKKFNVGLFWALVAVSVFLANVPGVNFVLMPVTQFVVIIHESCHALMTLLTGGFASATFVSDGAGHGGLTSSHGGNMFLIAQAGYIGQALYGCLLIYLGQFPKLSKHLLSIMGGSMFLAGLFAVPGLFSISGFLPALFSLLWAGGLGAVLLFCGFKFNKYWANTLVLFLAVQCVLNSLSLIWILIPHALGLSGGGFTDATVMAKMTLIPAFFWALSWMMISLVALFFTLRATYGSGLFKIAAKVKSKKS